MQRYKCNTKDKKNVFVGRTRGRRMVDSDLLSKSFVEFYIFIHVFKD